MTRSEDYGVRDGRRCLAAGLGEWPLLDLPQKKSLGRCRDDLVAWMQETRERFKTYHLLDLGLLQGLSVKRWMGCGHGAARRDAA